MTDKTEIREIRNEEMPFLEEVLYLAIFIPEGYEPLPRSVIQNPVVAKYIQNWTSRDYCLVSVFNGLLTGAAWYKWFNSGNKGYGYIADDIPELSIAIIPQYRNKGTGTLLLENLLVKAKEKEIHSLSLSVDIENPALNLYKRLGFVISSKEENSFIMIKML